MDKCNIAWGKILQHGHNIKSASYILLSIILIITIATNYHSSIEFSTNFESQTIMDQHGYFNTNYSKSDFENVSDDELSYYNKFWSPNDYVRVAEDLVFEIYTNFGVKNTTISVCPEDPQYDDVYCNKTHSPCKNGKKSPNGIQTGKCVPVGIPREHTKNNSYWNVCEVKAWCPVAIWPPLKHELGAILIQTNETLLSIQNFIEFTDYGLQRSTENSGAPKCLYDPDTNKHCPYIKLGDIVKYAKYNTKTYLEIARDTGAIFEIRINWDCSFNDINNCLPEFSFLRVDKDETYPHLWSFWDYKEIAPQKRILIYGMKIKYYISINARISKERSMNSFHISLICFFVVFAFASLVSIVMNYCGARCLTLVPNDSTDNLLQTP